MASYLGHDCKVVLGGRRCRCPFQGPRIPWVVACRLTEEIRNDQVVGKEQYSNSLDYTSTRNNQVKGVPAAVRLISVDGAGHAHEPKEVHSVERDMKPDDEQPEVPLA